MADWGTTSRSSGRPRRLLDRDGAGNLGPTRMQVGERQVVAVVGGLIVASPPTKACVHRASSLAVVALATKPLGTDWNSYR
jgi:hypothetical protein